MSLLAKLLFPLRHKPVTEVDPPYLDGLTFRQYIQSLDGPYCPQDIHDDVAWCGRYCGGKGGAR